MDDMIEFTKEYIIPLQIIIEYLPMHAKNREHWRIIMEEIIR